MEGALSETLGRVLEDPETLSKLAKLTQGLSPRPEETVQTHTDERIALLKALRPLVGSEKRKRIDDLLQIASVASLLKGDKVYVQS